jgi:hypothetical protein
MQDAVVNKSIPLVRVNGKCKTKFNQLLTPVLFALTVQVKSISAHELPLYKKVNTYVLTEGASELSMKVYVMSSTLTTAFLPFPKVPYRALCGDKSRPRLFRGSSRHDCINVSEGSV